MAWFLCDRGAALDTAGKTHRLPALRGSNQRAAAPATLFRPPGHPCRKGSQTFGLIPFRILWIAPAVGCQSTTRVSGARAVEGNQLPCLQKLLEPETTGGQPAPVSAKVPDLDPSRATGPRVWNKSFCPRPQRATGSRVYKSSSKTGPPGDNQSHRNPDLPV